MLGIRYKGILVYHVGYLFFIFTTLFNGVIPRGELLYCFKVKPCKLIIAHNNIAIGQSKNLIIHPVGYTLLKVIPLDNRLSNRAGIRTFEKQIKIN